MAKFPLTLVDGPPLKVGRYWRCQAAVFDQDHWRQCRRAVNPRYGTGVYCLCRIHGQPDRIKGAQVQLIKLQEQA